MLQYVRYMLYTLVQCICCIQHVAQRKVHIYPFTNKVSEIDHTLASADGVIDPTWAVQWSIYCPCLVFISAALDGTQWRKKHFSE